MDNTMWHVRFDNGKWDVEGYDEYRKHIWFEEEFGEPTNFVQLIASTGGGTVIDGVIGASCKKDAVITACKTLYKSCIDANSATWGF